MSSRQKKRGHGLINLPLLATSLSLQTVHVSVADAAKAMHGQAWNLRLSHLVVHKLPEEGTITKCCTAVRTDARFNGLQVAEQESGSQFQLRFLYLSNTLIVAQEHNMLENFLTRMRAIKVEALYQKERFNTVPNHKSGPDGKTHSEADRN